MTYSFAPGELRTIVLAWFVEDFEVVREGRRDLGERPEVKRILVPRAAVWVNEGTEADVTRAANYLKTQDVFRPAVFVYHPTREEDPIGRAKADLLGR